MSSPPKNMVFLCNSGLNMTIVNRSIRLQEEVRRQTGWTAFTMSGCSHSLSDSSPLRTFPFEGKTVFLFRRDGRNYALVEGVGDDFLGPDSYEYSE